MTSKASRVEVEKYLLSSLSSKESYKVFSDKAMTMEFFSPGTHQLLYRLYMEFHSTNKECLSPDILQEELSSTGFSREKMANLVSSFKLICTIDFQENKVPYYCEILKDYHAKTSLKAAFEEVAKVSNSDGNDSNIKAVGIAAQKLMSLKDQLIDKHIDTEIIDITDMQNIMCEEFDKRINMPWLYQGALSGIKQIDKAFGPGLRPGELTVFLAPPAGGKTTMMLSLADAMYKNAKKNIVYISLEMENKRIANKMLSNNAQVHSARIEAAQFTRKDVGAIKETFQKWHDLKAEGVNFKFVHICASGRVPINKVEDCIKTIIQQHDIDVCFVDYLECLSSGLKEDHWKEMGTICKFLRGVGSKYGFTTVSAVQLKRDAIERVRKSKDGKVEFGADDAQGSNQISADCDRIYVLILDKHDKNKMHWHTAKDRYGDSSYTALLQFDGACSRVYGDVTEYKNDNLFEGGLDIGSISQMPKETMIDKIDKQVNYISSDEVSKELQDYQKIDVDTFKEQEYEEDDDEDIVFG